MGPDCDILFARDRLSPPPEGRLLVLAAGAEPVVVWDGPAAEYPDRLRPGVVPDSPDDRSFADVAGALELGLSRVRDGEAADVVICSDGGFAAAALDLRHERIAALRLESAAVPREINLSVRILGGPRTFVIRAGMPVGIEIRGRLEKATRVELRLSAGSQMRRVIIPLEAGVVRHAEQIGIGSMPEEARQLIVELVDVPGDVRPEDDRDVLPLIPASGQPLVFLQCGAGSMTLPPGLLSGFDVTEDPALISRAAAVVLHDVPAAELAAYDEALEAAVQNGAGLMLAGAGSAFGLGGWDGRPIDELSPLKARPGRGKRVLAIALDASGSMEQKGRFRRAAEVVKSTFERLGPEDRLALILFAGEIEQHIIPRAAPGAVGRLKQLLDGVRPAGGTDLAAALDTMTRLECADDERALVIALDRRPRCCRPDHGEGPCLEAGLRQPEV